MTRTAVLTPNTGELRRSGMRAAFPVEALPIDAARHCANWILGRGTPLVVDGGHRWGGTGSVIRTVNYRCYVDAQHPTIGVYITLRAMGVASLPVSLNGEGYTVGALPTVIHYPLENVTGTGELDLALTFNWNGDVSDLSVDGIYVYESPVGLLDSLGSEGIVPRTPIYDGYDDRLSIAGLERSVEELRATYFRKGALYNWATGYSGSTGGLLNATTTYAALHPGSVKPAVQSRLMYTGVTTRNVRCAVMGRVTGGTGNVRVTMSSGDVHTFNVTSTATNGAWSTTQNLSIETNDPSRLETDGGIRGGSRDEITVEWRAAAAQECRLYAVSIFDMGGD